MIELISGLVPDALARLRLIRAGGGAVHEGDRPRQRREFVAMVDRAVTRLDGPLRVVSGAVPAGVALSYYAGGGFRSADRRIEHLLDAYPCGIRARIDGSGGRVLVKRCHDPLYESEERAGRVLRKGLFTGVRGGLLSRITHVFGRNAIHDCVLWQGRLIATTQARYLHLDPGTLETKEDPPLPYEEAAGPTPPSWCNHPKIDPATGRLMTYVLRVGPALRTEIELLEVGGDGARRRSYAWPGLLAPHGYSFTERFHLLPDLPATFAFTRFVLGLSRGILGNVADDPRRGLVVHLVPRDPAGEPFAVRFEMHGFAYHVVNSFEEAGRVVFDAFVSNLNPERESAQFELDPSRPVWTNLGGVFRFTVDPGTRAAEKRLLVPGLQRLTFHCIDESRRGGAYRHAWFVANDQHEGRSSEVGRFDAETGAIERWTTGDGVFLREPRIVARSAEEGDAWLVVPAYGVDETRFLLFDALDLARGPVAVLGASAILPYPVHGWAAPD